MATLHSCDGHTYVLWKLVTFSLHCFSLLLSPSLFSEIIIKCVKGLSPAGNSRCQGYTKTLAPSLLQSYTMSTPSSGSDGNGVGGEIFDVHEDLGSMSEIQQQLSVLSRQIGQPTLRLTYSERQRAEEAANAATVQAARKAEEERGERGGKSRNGTLACLPYTQFR